MEDIDCRKPFHTDKFFLRFVGFYPTKHPKLLYKLSGVISTTIGVLQLLSTLTFLVFHITDPEKASEVMLYFGAQFSFLFKLKNFIQQNDRMYIIEDLLTGGILNKFTTEEKGVYEKYEKQYKAVSGFYKMTVLVALMFYMTYPQLDTTSDEKKYPLLCWFPFDADEFYVQVYVVEVVSIALGAASVSLMDGLTIALIINGVAFFDILAGRIWRIAKDGDEEIAWKNVKGCAVYYDEILRYVQQIENTFSSGVLVQFFCSVVIICLTLFKITVTPPNSFQFISLFVFCSCMTSQVVMYCWFGQSLRDKSDFLTTACYMTDWDVCGTKIRKTLILMMEKAKRPAQLTAGNFFQLNLATLMVILRSSYSYFAVLHRLYNDHGD